MARLKTLILILILILILAKPWGFGLGAGPSGLYHKDKLAIFGYELIENIIKDYSNGKIINKKDNTAENEIDMLQIINVYIAKINGARKYKKKWVYQDYTRF